MKPRFRGHGHIIGYLLILIVLVLGILLGSVQKQLVIAVPQGIEGEALKEIAADFSNQRSVAIKIVEAPYEQLYDKVTKTASQYDVIMVDDPWLPALLEGPSGLTLEQLDDTPARQDEFKAAEQDFVRSC